MDESAHCFSKPNIIIIMLAPCNLPCIICTELFVCAPGIHALLMRMVIILFYPTRVCRVFSNKLGLGKHDFECMYVWIFLHENEEPKKWSLSFCSIIFYPPTIPIKEINFFEKLLRLKVYHSHSIQVSSP